MIMLRTGAVPGPISLIKYSKTHEPGWWNRYTRMPQKHLPERACGFESRSRHSFSGVSKESLFTLSR
jgi:hypothetical protein